MHTVVVKIYTPKGWHFQITEYNPIAPDSFISDLGSRTLPMILKCDTTFDVNETYRLYQQGSVFVCLFINLPRFRLEMNLEIWTYTRTLSSL